MAGAQWSATVGADAFRADAEQLMAAGLAWLERRPVQELLPKEVFDAWIREDARAEVLDKRVRPVTDRIVDRLIERARKDERTVREALGEKAVARIREQVEKLEPSEGSVRAVFEQGATEELLSNVVYNGILEFIRRADLLGPFIDRVPVLGGLRRRLLAGLKEEFERRAEKQVRAFLTGFSKAAVERAIEFVLAPQNRAKFRSMRLKLLDRVLDRRVCDTIPPDDRLQDLREQGWQRAREVLADPDRWIAELDRSREKHGGRSLADLREEWSLPDLSHRAAALLADHWVGFLQEDSAEAWYTAHPLPPRG